MLRDLCTANTNFDGDTFVGIKYENEKLQIHFPLGFNLSNDDETTRKDILLLISVLANNVYKRESTVPFNAIKNSTAMLPLQAYIFLIKDFFARGFYKEHVVEYSVSKKGKINWAQTIKKQNPYVQDTDIFYLDFITKKTNVNDNEIITLIHHYCVYKSFEKVGVLFTKTMPPKPLLKFNRNLFLSVLNKKLSTTFNDNNKNLFRNMITIIKNENDKQSNVCLRYGTYRFEYVWERLVDKVYGIENKQDYFPKSNWNLFAFNGVKSANAPLEPDTIMVNNNKVYVLDAKYYKFGYTKQASDLPGTSSIAKQIVYGEYIAEEEVFKKLHGNDLEVYNAFLMPFDSAMWESEKLHYIGDATADWKKQGKSYENVKGVLVDVKYLMKASLKYEHNEIADMIKFIEEHCCK